MTETRRKPKQTIAFLSITLGWILTNVFYSVYLRLRYGIASDNGVILFWSGLFVYLGWAIFIIYPLNRLNPHSPLFKKYLFPLITTIYGGTVYSILVWSVFRDLGLVTMFIPLALLVAFIFGLSYIYFIRKEKLLGMLQKHLLLKILFFISPIVLLGFFLWFLPTIFPSFVYRYMPSQIQDKIFLQAISRCKVGDSFERLNNAVPGRFEHMPTGSLSGSGPLMNYSVEVKNDTIIRLEVVIH